MPLPVLSLMVVVFSLTTGEFVIAGILPDVAADLSVSVPAAGMLVTGYAVGMIVGGPVVTILTARITRKRLVTGLVAVSIAGNLGSAIAPGYPVLLVTRFVAGLVVATFFAVAITIAVAASPAGKQSSTIAKLVLGMNLGIVLGTPIGTFIGQNLGWRVTFAAVAVLAVSGLALVLRFVPAGPALATGSVHSELRVFSRREVQLAIALTAVGNVGVITVFTYIAPLLTDVSGFAARTVPGLLLVYGAGAVIGNLAGGWMADRALMPSLAALLTGLAIVLALFWLFSGTREAAAVLTFAVGAFAFAIIPGMQTRVIAAASGAPTLAVAVNASCFQIAAAFGGWLGGRIIESPLGLHSIPLAGALLTAGGLAIAVVIIRGDSRRLRAGSPAVESTIVR